MTSSEANSKISATPFEEETTEEQFSLNNLRFISASIFIDANGMEMVIYWMNGERVLISMTNMNRESYTKLIAFC